MQINSFFPDATIAPNLRSQILKADLLQVNKQSWGSCFESTALQATNYYKEGESSSSFRTSLFNHRSI